MESIFATLFGSPLLFAMRLLLWLTIGFIACSDLTTSTTSSAITSNYRIIRVLSLEGYTLETYPGGIATREEGELAMVVPWSSSIQVTIRDRLGVMIANGSIYPGAWQFGDADPWISKQWVGGIEVSVSNFKVAVEREVAGPGQPSIVRATVVEPDTNEAVPITQPEWASANTAFVTVTPSASNPFEATVTHVQPAPGPVTFCFNQGLYCWDATLPVPNFGAAYRRGNGIGSAINFSSFANGDHTIAIRFLAQYPRGLDGMLFGNGEVGPNEYSLSIGGDSPSNMLLNPYVWFQLRLGNDRHTFVAPSFERKTYVTSGTSAPPPPPIFWHQIAVVRQSNAIGVYLDGVQLPRVGLNGTPASGWIPAPSHTFSGTFRSGLRPTGPYEQQFYGFVDDVAVFSTAKSMTELEDLAYAGRLTGDETDLLHAVLFDGPDARSNIRQPYNTFDTVVFPPLPPQRVSHERDATKDRTQLPRPYQTMTHQLPFLPGDVWVVIQGNDSEGSHRHRASHSWDFYRVPPSLVASAWTGGPTMAWSAIDYMYSVGARVLGTTTGTVTHLSYAGVGTQTTGTNEWAVHVDVDHELLRTPPGASVTPNTVVAQVWFTAHLHYSSGTGSGPDAQTTPMEFVDYEVSRDSGRTWLPKSYGQPDVGEWVRRPVAGAPPIVDTSCQTSDYVARREFHCDDPELDVRLESFAAPSVVARSWDRLDVAVRAHVPRAMTWTWNGGQWLDRSHGVPYGYDEIMGQPKLVAVSPTRVLAVARRGIKDHYDQGPLAWKSFDGSTWTDYSELTLADVPVISDPALVSHAPGLAYAAAIDVAGHLRVALFEGVGWDTVVDIGGAGTASARFIGTPALVAMDGDVHAFARGEDGLLYQATLTVSVGDWSTASAIQSMPVAGNPIALSTAPSRLEVFVRGTGGQLYRTTKVSGGSWTAYQQVGTEPIVGDPAVVSRNPNMIDLFVRRPDNALWRRHTSDLINWSAYDSLGGYITSSPGVASWGPDRLDVFVLGMDRTLYTKWWATGHPWSEWQSRGGFHP